MELCSEFTLLSCEETKTDHNWSSIEGGVLLLIAGKIGSVDDYVMFSAVCRSWYLRATEFYNNINHKLNLGPLYLSGTDLDTRRITLRNPATDTTLVRDLPETAGTRCWGSPFGWIITYDHTILKFSLINPITGATLPLPDLPDWANFGNHRETIKTFLTASPDSDPDDCLVFFVSGYSKLGFAGPGSERWSRIQGDVDLFDLACFKGNIYGIEYSSTCDVQLFLFQLNQPLEKGKQKGRLVHQALHIRTLKLIPDPDTDTSDKHLVDLNGELCLCVLYYSSSFTTKFKIFKIDLSNGKLTHVVSLGDHCLFLGDNYSFSRKATCPPAKIFEQPHHGLHEFVSNYVFYSHYRHSRGAMGYDNRPFDVEVWDVSMNPSKVCSRMDSETPLYGPLWILPSIKIRKLEDCPDAEVKSSIKGRSDAKVESSKKGRLRKSHNV